jgi:phosphotransacetylase
MHSLIDLIERARSTKRRSVFPEGDDPRIIEAARRLRADGIVEPILISKPLRSAPNAFIRRVRRCWPLASRVISIAAKPKA